MALLRNWAGSGATILAVLAAQAGATDANPAADASVASLQEVIVTAQKRSENLRDVPISIAVLDQKSLLESRIQNVVDLETLVSGVVFTTDRAGAPSYAIRGISSNVGNDSGVAIHLDGVYLGARNDQSSPFFDVSRVEVLKGPQGTLYGRNSTGGTINIITNDPQTQPKAFIQATAGNFSLLESEGYITGPVSGENLLGRIAFKVSSLPGYGRNLATGAGVNGARSISARAKLEWRITDNLQAMLSAYGSDVTSSYVDQLTALFPTPVQRGGVTVGGPLTTNLLASILGDPRYLEATGYDSNRTGPNGVEDRIGGGLLHMTWDLGWAAMTSSTGYRSARHDEQTDFIGTADQAASYRYNNYSQKQTSEELNLSSSGSTQWVWTTGLFYYHSHRSGGFDAPLDTSYDAPLGAPVFKADFTNSVEKYDTNAYAVYGQMSHPIFSDLNLTVGGRYSWESDHDQESQVIVPLVPFSSIDQKASFNAFTPKAALEWKATGNLNAYVTYSKGFKSGGFSPGSFVSRNFDPEYVHNYEVGMKGSYAGGRFKFNLAGFRMDYSNLQVNTFVLNNGVPSLVVANAAKARINGAEGDYTLQVSPWLSLDGNVTFLDAKYRQFLAGYALSNNGYSIDVAGNSLPGSPRFSMNLGADIHFGHMASWEGTFRGEYGYQSTIYYTPFENLDGVSQPGAGIANAYVTFTNAESGWSMNLWTRNLSDRRVASFVGGYYDNVLYTGYFKTTAFRPPRTFGVTFSKNL